MSKNHIFTYLDINLHNHLSSQYIILGGDIM